MVIDSFMFGDELSVLELRLGQLDSVVDWFVFNEINQTHSGKPKPLYYQENKQRFAKWNHKIICTTPHFGSMGSWALETAQRRAVEASILQLNPQPNDVLIASDCDEIPNPEIIKSYTAEMGLRNLKQLTFWYNFSNLFNYGSRWSCRARLGTIQNMRDAGGLGPFHGGPKDDMDPNFPCIENAGWHCSYFSDSLERIRRKVNSFAHTDLQHIVNGYSDKQLFDIVVQGRDLYLRPDMGNAEKWQSDDSRLPPYYLQNREHFKGFTEEQFKENHQQLI